MPSPVSPAARLETGTLTGSLRFHRQQPDGRADVKPMSQCRRWRADAAAGERGGRLTGHIRAHQTTGGNLRPTAGM